MNLRQRLEEFVKDLRDGPHYCDVSYRRDDYTANGLDKLLDEASDEEWQPLTADTVLPESGYLVLRHLGGYLELASYQKRVNWWATGDKDYRDVWELTADYTHYRVLLGPEGL